MKKNPKLKITITGDYSALTKTDACFCALVQTLAEEHVFNGADGATAATAHGQIDATIAPLKKGEIH